VNLKRPAELQPTVVPAPAKRIRRSVSSVHDQNIAEHSQIDQLEAEEHPIPAKRLTAAMKGKGKQVSTQSDLSDQDRNELMRLMSEGKSNREIAHDFLTETQYNLSENRVSDLRRRWGSKSAKKASIPGMSASFVRWSDISNRDLENSLSARSSRANSNEPVTPQAGPSSASQRRAQRQPLFDYSSYDESTPQPATIKQKKRMPIVAHKRSIIMSPLPSRIGTPGQ
jgi:hypothetical protein